MKSRPRSLECLENPLFARLYLAQTVNLIGDALTWLGLALLAFELAGNQAGTVLAGALTLRVIAFVVLSPIAGAIADRLDRKPLMITTHIARMGIVCLLPFVTQIWQIYAIVLSLNIFYAFFAPTYTASISLVTTAADRPQAIALSSATYQLLGVLGPGLAGAVAAFVGTRSVFLLDGVTFLIAAIVLATLPGKLMVNPDRQTARTLNRTLQDIQVGTQMGTQCLWLDQSMRYALLLQLVGAIVGAAILVNTIGYVQATLHFGKIEYGWVMAAFGVGATLASVGLTSTSFSRLNPLWLVSIGTIFITLAVLPANLADLGGLLILWAIAGMGQTLINVPTQTLIADRVAVELQGRVYGAHFAWSHLWWAFAYPLAGWMGINFPTANFFCSSLLGLGGFALVNFGFWPKQSADRHDGSWHEHEHNHDAAHQHSHPDSPHLASQAAHAHLHFHSLPHAQCHIN
jgi:MFS transporter, NRE family, putaive nickel resistance protein